MHNFACVLSFWYALIIFQFSFNSQINFLLNEPSGSGL